MQSLPIVQMKVLQFRECFWSAELYGEFQKIS